MSPDFPGDRHHFGKLPLSYQRASWRFHYPYDLPEAENKINVLPESHNNFKENIIMSEITKESRAERAIACHNKAYNCAQSVAFAFLDKVDIDPETLFKVTEGLGLGMGGMEGTCGAISAAAVLAGLKISTADLEKPNSKGTSYKAAKACIAAFKEKNSTIVCRELKGVDTGKVLRACPDCICDAVAIIEENLFPEE